MDVKNEELTPKQIVQELDKYIIGQDKAKKSVSIALRNRWRRQQVQDELREEIMPNNIILIGPTGVGKTEIARRLARLANAPFVKVEASKFTEVGYVGRDVESIIRDLVDLSVSMVRSQKTAEVEEKAEDLAEERLLEGILEVVVEAASEKEGRPFVGVPERVAVDREVMRPTPIRCMPASVMRAGFGVDDDQPAAVSDPQVVTDLRCAAGSPLAVYLERLFGDPCVRIYQIETRRSPMVLRAAGRHCQQVSVPSDPSDLARAAQRNAQALDNITVFR